MNAVLRRDGFFVRKILTERGRAVGQYKGLISPKNRKRLREEWKRGNRDEVMEELFWTLQKIGKELRLIDPSDDRSGEILAVAPRLLPKEPCVGA
ncbi:hypothetical protein COX03_03550 [Candidatus Woesebacteria bacterium CG22_combo_CG10-13_8_21_14_all_39_10]|uniref:Uncharacterized protein n=1 Tax=Candidatus Woesebacteria bacterium CG22_combo_CG10-13_8_21_14_all_39_10 TaxID=1975059 RepID=A0A2H0BI63_9BACT|nr:MAG: hypothetical protein COX03_03550 [Candidatus Woesebacteria bacterium CG22_combo_CG10-13_8_21_14_all_39_10]